MKILRGESGTALIEFAVFLSFFGLLLSGITDYSIYIQQEMVLSQAAAAGAAYGIIPGNQENLTGMKAAATAAATGVSGMTVTAVDVYICTAGGSAVTSTATCSGYYTSPMMYVQVKTSATVPAALKWAGISSSLTLQGFAQYRVPWTK
jgi:Flp pilus assembly protein TadG